MNRRVADIDRLTELLDRHGGDFDAWRDVKDARWARELVLAEPDARRALEAARRLDIMLDARAADFAADVMLVERTIGAVAPALTRRSGETRRWAARLAACFLLAAVFGGAFDQLVLSPLSPESAEMAMLDSLVYGPGEVELP